MNLGRESIGPVLLGLATLGIQSVSEHDQGGSSKVWRAGKKLLGVYLPFRFRAGNPFHAGIPWQGMDLGLKVMSRVVAS